MITTCNQQQQSSMFGFRLFKTIFFSSFRAPQVTSLISAPVKHLPNTEYAFSASTNYMIRNNNKQYYNYNRDEDDHTDNSNMIFRRQHPISFYDTNNDNNNQTTIAMSRRKALIASVFLVSGGTSFLVDPSPALAATAIVDNKVTKNGIKITASSSACETQCVHKCKQKYGQTSSKGYKDCINDCKSSHEDKCQENPPPLGVREPKLIPSQPIPNLYDRWQDELLKLN